MICVVDMLCYFTVALFCYLQNGRNILHLSMIKGNTELSKWIIEQSLVSVDITDKVSSLICTVCTINVLENH